LIVGEVAVVFTALSKPPKIKITICVGDNPPLFLWINTEPRQHGVGQMPLTSADHPQALKHDCYLDCSRVTTFPPGEMANAKARGSISPALAAKIADFIEENRPVTLRIEQQRLIVDGLREIA
jgi:hypothetical protein